MCNGFWSTLRTLEMNIGRSESSRLIVQRIFLVWFDKTLVETTNSSILSRSLNEIWGWNAYFREIGLGVGTRRTASGFLVGVNKAHPIMIIWYGCDWYTEQKWDPSLHPQIVQYLIHWDKIWGWSESSFFRDWIEVCLWDPSNNVTYCIPHFSNLVCLKSVV
jgi:hypothetical protein